MAKKYIDAEKLKADIERLQRAAAITMKELQMDEPSESMRGELDAYDEILWFIDSLQQEQESVAERFARIVRGNLIGIDKEVQQKFEQLYLEVTGNKMYGGYND